MIHIFSNLPSTPINHPETFIFICSCVSYRYLICTGHFKKKPPCILILTLQNMSSVLIALRRWRFSCVCLRIFNSFLFRRFFIFCFIIKFFWLFWLWNFILKNKLHWAQLIRVDKTYIQLCNWNTRSVIRIKNIQWNT